MTDQKHSAPPDKDLRETTDMPAQSGSGGGNTARDVGSRDEEKSATGADPEPTRATKQDKVQPATGTRSDHEGAQR